MFKFIKSFCVFSIVLLLPFLFIGCKDNNQPKDKIKIGDVSYQTLTQAVENAKSQDTIKIYDDISDNKNVVINKPLSIEGVLKEGQIKPKFYGSITINTTGQTDNTTIKNIEIIHQGIKADGLNNDTTIGINLIDGGLEIKSSSIMLDSSSSPNAQASGIIISRKINSKNIMPIVIEGNNFGLYKTDNQNLSGALIIKSNDPESYQHLLINENDLFFKNSFLIKDQANQIVSIDYSSQPNTYTFLVTSSMKNLIDSLQNNQPTTYCTYILHPTSSINEQTDKPIVINKQTKLIIDGSYPADFKNSQIDVQGSLLVDGQIKNVQMKRIFPTSYISINNNLKNNSINII